MKYNWPAVVDAFRKIALDNVAIECSKDARAGFQTYITTEMQKTDTFHPYDNDGELSRALSNWPEGKCNYRNVKQYWKFKNARWRAEDMVLDALYAIFEEIGERIESHFKDPWNFAPGVTLPSKISGKIEWEDLATESNMRKILKAARA